jgi:hypothetical protein
MKSVLFAAVLLSLNALGAAAETLSNEKLVKLQTVMQGYIDANAINGALLRFDASTSQVTELFATKAHPKIMTIGQHFVMCADFVDAQGKPVMGNFYIAQDGDRFVVFNTTWGEDAALMSMMKDGKASMAN